MLVINAFTCMQPHVLAQLNSYDLYVPAKFQHSTQSCTYTVYTCHACNVKFCTCMYMARAVCVLKFTRLLVSSTRS